MPDQAPPERLRLFISYASADIAAAEWLGERLLLEGYGVWLDRWHLPAGCDWSREIGRVMAEESFRVIHLLSRHAMHDSYAAPERGRACDLGRERGEPFIIPLLLEPLTRTQRPIELQNLVAIDFQDWGDGLDGLLRGLEAVEAPRCPAAGPHAVRPAHWSSVVIQGSERLVSNAFAIEGVPETLHYYKLRKLLTGPERYALGRAWPHWNPFGSGHAISFFEPPQSLPEGIQLVHQYSGRWRYLHQLADQPIGHVIPACLRIVFTHHCLCLGLERWRQVTAHGSRQRSTHWLYFPAGLVPGDKLKANNWSGKRVSIKLIGERRHKGEPFRAHLAFSPVLEQIEPGTFLLYLRLGVRPLQTDGTPFESAKIGPRVKAATRGWTNADLLARLRAVTGFLADDDGEIRLGPAGQARIRLRAIEGDVPWALDENLLGRLGAEPASGELESGPELDLEPEWAPEEP